MKIFECKELTIEEVSDLGITIKIKLSYDNLVNCYAPKLKSHYPEKEVMDFEEYFTILRNIASEYSGYFDLECRIADKGKKIRTLVNRVDIYKNDLSSIFFNESATIKKLKGFFLCKDEDSLSYFAKKVIDFNKNTDIVFELLEELLVYLLQLDRK